MATISQLVAEFHTTDDDKDRDDGISETFLFNGKIIGQNQSWGKDLVFRDNSINLGQTFDVSHERVEFSDIGRCQYRYLMDNDDGWHVIFRIKATLSDGSQHLVADEPRNVANGSPRDGTIALHA